MNSLDLGDCLEEFELLSELPGLILQWRVLDTTSGRDDRVLTQGPMLACDPEQAWQRIQEAEKGLSYLQHPGLVRPLRFLLREGQLYWVSPLPPLVSLADYLQQQAPPLTSMVSWLGELCALLHECHQLTPPLYAQKIGVHSLCIQDHQIRLLGLGMDRDCRLVFVPLEEDAPTPLDGSEGVSADVWCVANLLSLWVGRAGGLVSESYRRHTALRSLMVLATSKDRNKRPPNLMALKGRLEKLPRPKAPVELKVGRLGRWVARWNRYSVPISWVCMVVFFGLALLLGHPGPSLAPAKPAPVRRSTQARRKLDPTAPQVYFQRASPRAQPTARPPG